MLIYVILLWNYINNPLRLLTIQQVFTFKSTINIISFIFKALLKVLLSVIKSVTNKSFCFLHILFIMKKM